jgi:hypothetical protein
MGQLLSFIHSLRTLNLDNNTISHYVTYSTYKIQSRFSSHIEQIRLIMLGNVFSSSLETNVSQYVGHISVADIMTGFIITFSDVLLS